MEKVIIRAKYLLILYDSIFFWSPTNKYATTILIKNGVNMEPKKLTINNTNTNTKENMIVSSLLKIFLNRLFN